MGSPWNWVSAQGSQENRMMGLPDGRKYFKISLAVSIQYRRVSDTQPRYRSIYRAYYVARVKTYLQWMTNRNKMLTAQHMLANPRDAFRGQSRSPNMVPLNMLGIVSY